MQRKRIGIISYNNNIRYLSYINHQIYARKYDYEYIFDITRESVKSLYYSKLYKILKFIDLYDEVLWIDDDAFFVDFSKSLDDIFRDYTSDLIIADSPKRGNEWTFINSGVMYFRNTIKTKEFLLDCVSLEEEYIKRHWNYGLWGLVTNGEQDAITYLLESKKYKNGFYTKMDFKEINARPDNFHKNSNTTPFIVHFAGVSNREVKIAEFAEKYKLTPYLTPHKDNNADSLMFKTSDNKKLNTLGLQHHIISRKYDTQSRVVDWIFRHPFRFYLGRLYHFYIKRDEKNVPQD